jgi:hypothetical protein
MDLQKCASPLLRDCAASVNIDALFETINGIYSSLTWFEKIQQKIISLTLKSENNRG